MHIGASSVYISAKPTIVLLPPSLLAVLAYAKQHSGFQNSSYLRASHKTALNTLQLSSIHFCLNNTFHSLILLLIIFSPGKLFFFQNQGLELGTSVLLKNPVPHHV